MGHMAVFVTHHLNLNMPGLFNIFFNINFGVSKSRFCFRAAGLKSLGQGKVRMSHSHTASAAAGRGFNNDRILNALGNFQRVLFVFHRSVAAGSGGRSGFFRHSDGLNLVAHQAHHFRFWSDKLNLAAGANFGEVGVFSQKAVAGMDSFGVGNFGGRNQGWNI